MSTSVLLPPALLAGCGARAPESPGEKAALVSQPLTTQTFAGGGTPYVATACSGAAPAPSVVTGGGPDGANFLRITRGSDFGAVNGVAFARSDAGAFTEVTMDFDFRITPGSGRADGFGVAFVDTARNNETGAACFPGEEPNLAGALGVGFDVYQNGGEANNNHVSVHWNGAKVADFAAGSVNLASGAWVHAQIVLRPGGGRNDVTVKLTPAGGTTSTVVDRQVVTGLAPYEGRVAFVARTGGQTASHDLANVNVAYTADPAVVGQMSDLVTLPTVPVHSLYLPNGKLMFFDRMWEGSDDMPRLWDPATSTTSMMPHPDFELFCAGHAFDGQGRAIILGGHDMQDGVGLATSFAYDYASNSFARLPDMNAGRWYPTVTTTGRGDLLVIGGSITPGVNNQLPQVLQTRTHTYRDLTGANRDLPLYPMMFLAPDGRIFNAGPNRSAAFLALGGTGAWSPAITSSFEREYGSAVIMDGVVSLIGGGYVTNTVERIDLNSATPAWQLAAPMAYARRQLNATILPDGTVLATGGSKTPAFNDNAGAIMATEIWDPAANVWTRGAAVRKSRLYHSEAVLLADGRVAILGGGHPAGTNGGTDNFDLEIYSPPYLFKGARPTIDSAPESAAVGQTFFLGTPEAASIGKVTLVRLTAVTHALNMDQRLSTLTFQATTGGLQVTLPANENLTPPGYYMLFVVNGAGVPSVARIISVQRPYTQTAAGLVSIEAERHHRNVPQGGKSWAPSTPAGFSGTGALTASPNSGTNQNTGYVTASPRLDYWVNFTRTGTHHVWIRGLGANGEDDSVHVGLDGAAVASADRVSGFGAAIGWTKGTMDGPVATIDVPTTGLHRVNVWMREDGTVVDKLVVTSDASYTPTGAGPAETD